MVVELGLSGQCKCETDLGEGNPMLKLWNGSELAAHSFSYTDQGILALVPWVPAVTDERSAVDSLQSRCLLNFNPHATRYTLAEASWPGCDLLAPFFHTWLAVLVRAGKRR